MNFEFLLASIILGFSTSPNCAMLCLPVLAPPMVGEKKTVQSSLIGTFVFSMGRLIAYLLVGSVVVALGFSSLTSMSALWRKGATVALWVFTLLYGIWMAFRWPNSFACPAKRYAQLPLLILGLLVGITPCIPLGMIVLYSTLAESLIDAWLVYILFWASNTIFIVLAGVLSGWIGGKLRSKISPNRVRRVCGMTLAFVGFLYFISILV